MRGTLVEVAYWRVWENRDPELGGGYEGTATLVCGHTAKVTLTKANRYGGGRRLDDQGRPVACHCLACVCRREVA